MTKKVSSLKELLPVLEPQSGNQKTIAEDVDGEISTLVVNKLRGAFKAVKAPGFDMC
jgi:hypothetical protein